MQFNMVGILQVVFKQKFEYISIKNGDRWKCHVTKKMSISFLCLIDLDFDLHKKFARLKLK